MANGDYSGAFEQERRDKDRKILDKYRTQTSGIIDESGNLRSDFNYEPITEYTPWQISNLAGGLDTYKEFSEAELEDFSKMMVGDHSLLLLPEQELRARKQSVEKYTLEQLVLFGKKNSKDIANLGWDANPESLIEYNLQAPYFRQESRVFNEVVDKIEASRKVIEEIDKDKEAYVQGKFTNISGVARAFYSTLPKKRIAEEFMAWEQNAQIIAIGEYGMGQFASDNIENAYATGERQEAELESLNKEIRRTIEGLGSTPSPDQIAELRKGIREKEEAIAEKYNNAEQAWQSLTLRLMETSRKAYDSTQSEEEQEEQNEATRTTS